MKTTNIAGYKFIALGELPTLRDALLEKTRELALKGTILLSHEGINLSLAGTDHLIEAFKHYLQQDIRFADIRFRVSVSSHQPFKRMKVKIRQEIITMRQPTVRPELARAPSISPQEFKAWLDEKREMTVLDTRNEFEVRAGTFDEAIHFGLSDFSEFPKAAQALEKNKPIVMFCTGGIRCEKAALHLLAEGHNEVYQLDGGILNYFSEVGAAHYKGDCFVFDERVALNAELKVADRI